MEAFHTSPSWEIEAIAGLIPIYLHLLKISGHQQLRTAFLSSNYIINFLFENKHAKNSSLYCFSLEKLISKQ